MIDSTAVRLEHCALGLGSNLGQSDQILQRAFEQLGEWPGVELGLRSQLYKTSPIGPPQPDYINACVLLKTTLTPVQLLNTLLQIEQGFGRVRRERWGPRSLDIDILLYGHHALQTPDVIIPHPRMHQRAFVLVPLNEIAAHWWHPTLKKTIADLVSSIDLKGVEPWSPA